MRRRSPPTSCPAVLASTGSRGAAETAAALAHYASDGWEDQPPFEFTAYQDDTVHAALRAAFGGVCAYCDAVVSAFDIEHYRPKGAIQTANGKLRPGYYWRAADWMNLLAACPACNQRRYTEDHDGTEELTGKAAWFPLADETKRATDAAGEAHEEPLLLHPYHDEPAQHLEFREEGVVRARLGSDGQPSPRGEETIRLLGLNRRDLVDRRADRLIVIEAALIKAIKAWQWWDADSEDRDREERYRARLDELMQLVDDRKGFSAMALQILEVLRPEEGEEPVLGQPGGRPPH